MRASQRGSNMALIHSTPVFDPKAEFNSLVQVGPYTSICPLAKNADWEKSAAIVRNLSSMREKIRALEKTIKTLTTQDEK